MGLVSVSVLVSETAGKIHLNDNMRHKNKKHKNLFSVSEISYMNCYFIKSQKIQRETEGPT